MGFYRAAFNPLKYYFSGQTGEDYLRRNGVHKRLAASLRARPYKRPIRKGRKRTYGRRKYSRGRRTINFKSYNRRTRKFAFKIDPITSTVNENGVFASNVLMRLSYLDNNAHTDLRNVTDQFNIDKVVIKFFIQNTDASSGDQPTICRMRWRYDPDSFTNDHSDASMSFTAIGNHTHYHERILKTEKYYYMSFKPKWYVNRPSELSSISVKDHPKFVTFDTKNIWDGTGTQPTTPASANGIFYSIQGNSGLVVQMEPTIYVTGRGISTGAVHAD